MNIGDGFTTGPVEAAYVINELVKPAAVIASHANEVGTVGGKVRPGSKTEAFMKAVKVPVHIPLSGKTMEFDAAGSARPDAEHRRAGSAAMDAAVANALAFVERHGVVLASARGPAERLIEAIAGEPSPATGGRIRARTKSTGCSPRRAIPSRFSSAVWSVAKSLSCTEGSGPRWCVWPPGSRRSNSARCETSTRPRVGMSPMKSRFPTGYRSRSCGRAGHARGRGRRAVRTLAAVACRTGARSHRR